MLRELVRPLAVIGTVFVGLLGVQAWTSYYPASDIFSVVGISGTHANDGRLCQRYRSGGSGPFSRRTPDESCHPALPRSSDVPASPSRHPNYRRTENIYVNFWTRQPRSVSVRSHWRDSLEYERARDSVSSALRDRGATIVACKDQRLGRVYGHLFAELWADRAFNVTIQGFRSPRIDGADYQLTVAASPKPLYAC